MGHAEILCVDRLANAVVEIEANGQFDPSHRLQPCKDRRGGHGSTGDEIVAMLAISFPKDLIGRNRAPEAEIIERRQPVLHILNVFKNEHGAILPNHAAPTQTLGEIT